MKYNTHCLSTLGRVANKLAEGVAHERHLAAELDIAADNHPAGPVRGMGELLGGLHTPHGQTKSVAHPTSLQQGSVERAHQDLGRHFWYGPQGVHDAASTRSQKSPCKPDHTICVDPSCPVVSVTRTQNNQLSAQLDIEDVSRC